MERKFNSVLIASSYDTNVDKSIATYTKNEMDLLSIRIDRNMYGRETVYLESCLSNKKYKAIKAHEVTKNINEPFVCLDEAILLPEDVSNSINMTRSNKEKLNIARFALGSIKYGKVRTRN